MTLAYFTWGFFIANLIWPGNYFMLGYKCHWSKEGVGLWKWLFQNSNSKRKSKYEIPSDGSGIGGSELREVRFESATIDSWHGEWLDEHANTPMGPDPDSADSSIDTMELIVTRP